MTICRLPSQPPRLNAFHSAKQCSPLLDSTLCVLSSSSARRMCGQAERMFNYGDERRWTLSATRRPLDRNWIWHEASIIHCWEHMLCFQLIDDAKKESEKPFEVQWWKSKRLWNQISFHFYFLAIFGRIASSAQINLLIFTTWKTFLVSRFWCWFCWCRGKALVWISSLRHSHNSSDTSTAIWFRSQTGASSAKCGERNDHLRRLCWHCTLHLVEAAWACRSPDKKASHDDNHCQ